MHIPAADHLVQEVACHIHNVLQEIVYAENVLVILIMPIFKSSV